MVQGYHTSMTSGFPCTGIIICRSPEGNLVYNKVKTNWSTKIAGGGGDFRFSAYGKSTPVTVSTGQGGRLRLVQLRVVTLFNSSWCKACAFPQGGLCYNIEIRELNLTFYNEIVYQS